MLLEELGAKSSLPATAAVGRELQRFGCLTPRDCAQEAFARLYQRSWDTGVLPLRHPWIMRPEDHLFGLAMKLREENDGWGPKGHEGTFERVQLAAWLRKSAQLIPADAVPGERRCLEWDSAQYSRHYFRDHCSFFDVVTFAEGGEARTITGQHGQRRYVVDIHEADATVPADSAGIVVCAQIFEHLRRPHVAMAQLFRLVAPGGFVVWSAPLFSEVHGAPDDFFRYTPHGAVALSEDAGFQVMNLYAPGGLRELAGYLLGITAPYWPESAILDDAHTNWPLQVYILLRKPDNIN